MSEECKLCKPGGGKRKFSWEDSEGFEVDAFLELTPIPKITFPDGTEEIDNCPMCGRKL